MRSRRIVTLAAAASVAVGLVAMGTTAPAAAASRRPQPVSKLLPTVPAGEASWVSVSWTTPQKLCGAGLTVVGDGVEIGYPSNTATYTSFSQSDRLKPKQTDYTAFTVHPKVDGPFFVPLVATLTYDTCGPDAVEKSRTYRLMLPILPVRPTQS